MFFVHCASFGTACPPSAFDPQVVFPYSIKGLYAAVRNSATLSGSTTDGVDKTHRPRDTVQVPHSCRVCYASQAIARLEPWHRCDLPTKTIF
jgi:hypothetical protein